MRRLPLGMVGPRSPVAAEPAASSGLSWLTVDPSALSAGQNASRIGDTTASSIEINGGSTADALTDYGSLSLDVSSLDLGNKSGTLLLHLETTDSPTADDGAIVMLGVSDNAGDLNNSSDVQAFLGIRRNTASTSAGRWFMGTLSAGSNGSLLVGTMLSVRIANGTIERCTRYLFDSSGNDLAGQGHTAAAASTGDAGTVDIVVVVGREDSGAGAVTWGGTLKYMWIEDP